MARGHGHHLWSSSRSILANFSHVVQLRAPLARAMLEPMREQARGRPSAIEVPLPGIDAPLAMGNSSRAPTANGSMNKLLPEDVAAHDWYRFVLSFPPHLVRDYMSRFGIRPGGVLLDPFCGTGTTLVEAKKNGVESIGVEAIPICHLAASVK